jgi:hypothetical protein
MFDQDDAKESITMNNSKLMHLFKDFLDIRGLSSSANLDGWLSGFD